MDLTTAKKGDRVRILADCLGSTDDEQERSIPAGSLGTVLDVDIRESGPLLHVETCGCWITYDETDAHEVEPADDRDLTVAGIIESIETFDRECQEAEETDTGTAWELFGDIRRRLLATLERKTS